MKTLADLRHIVILSLFLVFVTGSVSRYSSAIEFSLKQPAVNVSAVFLLSPKQLSQRIDRLPLSVLRQLAQSGQGIAAFQLAVHFLSQKNVTAARLYWQPYFAHFNLKQQTFITKQLAELSAWDDLSMLANKLQLPEGLAKQYWLLQQGEDISKVDATLVQKLGFSVTLAQQSANQQCHYNVLLMSDHLQGLNQLKDYKSRYQQQPEPMAKSFCFTQPVYVANNIHCKLTQGQQQCDWFNASRTIAWPDGFDFIVMMTKEGLAYVKGGIMQLNSRHQYAVFLHELMHFSGFEDEYPLPKKKQVWICSQQGYVAPNLYVANELAPPKEWHKSSACDSGVAYKPSKGWSIMQYQQMGLSAQYREIWHQVMKNNAVDVVRFNDYFQYLQSQQSSDGLSDLSEHSE